MSGVEREIITLDFPVPGECAGWRLDHFLKRRIGRLSRTKIQLIIREQITFADGRRARPSTSVRAGETIVLRRPAPVEPEVPRHFTILYEDEDVIVIDKPAGLPMHTRRRSSRRRTRSRRCCASATPTSPCRWRTGSTARRRACCSSRARARRRASSRSPSRNAQIDKTYLLALVKGAPPDEGVVDQPLGLLDTQSRVMMGILPVGRGLPSVRRFRVLRRFAAHALVEASPETGRQHQIRVHLAALGHPLVGDKLYGASEELFMRACDEGLTPELLEAFDGLPRHALHAHRLTFPHPATRADVTVESPLADDLVAYMQRPRRLSR